MTSPYGSPPAAPLNAPPAAEQQPGLQAGTSGVIYANIVVVYGPGAGIFIYSPTPGPGNLIGSWAGSAGTDIYGNTYPQGISAAAGALLTIGTSSAGIITGTTIPADLDTHYAGIMKAATVFHQSATGYSYEGVLSTNVYVFGNGSTGAGPFVAEAFRIIPGSLGGEISYALDFPYTLRFSTNVTGRYESGYVEHNAGLNRYESGAEMRFYSGSLLSLEATDAAFRIDGKSAPRGLLYYEQITAAVNTGAVANTDYAVYTTASTVTFQPGRAYEFKIMNGKIKSAAAQQPHYDLFKGTGVAGTRLVRGPRIQIVTTGIDIALTPMMIFCNSTAAAVTTTLTFGISPSVATLVTFDAAAAPNDAQVLIYDIGSTTDITGVTSV